MAEEFIYGKINGSPLQLLIRWFLPSKDFGDFPMVSSLIDEDKKWRKANAIKALFLPFEANSILKIPLSYNLPDDELIWVGNKKGSLTVKSAYYIAAKIVDSS